MSHPESTTTTTTTTTPEEIFPIWSIVASYADDETVKQSFLFIPELKQIGYMEIAMRASLETHRFLEQESQKESTIYGKNPWRSLDFAKKDSSSTEQKLWAMWSCRWKVMDGFVEKTSVNHNTFFRLAGITAQRYTNWRREYSGQRYFCPSTYCVSDDKQLGLRAENNVLSNWVWIKIVGVRPRVEVLSKYLIETQQLEGIHSNL